MPDGFSVPNRHGFVTFCLFLMQNPHKWGLLDLLILRTFVAANKLRRRVKAVAQHSSSAPCTSLAPIKGYY